MMSSRAPNSQGLWVEMHAAGFLSFFLLSSLVAQRPTPAVATNSILDRALMEQPTGYQNSTIHRLDKSQPNFNYTLSDGDQVACILRESQPTLRSRNLRSPLKRKPSFEVKRGNSTKSGRGALRAQQTFNAEVGSCPEGRIPVRKSRDIYNLTSAFLTAGTPFDAAQQLSDAKLRVGKRVATPNTLRPPDGEDKPSSHEHAYVQADDTASGPVKGLEVILNIWEPYVENRDEFSLAQFWLISGSYMGNVSTTSREYSTVLNTIEAGWQVFEGLYGDNRSRLFLFWTADAYNDTGCYNLHCSGFVQTSNKVLVGGSFTPISVVNSTQYEIELLVVRDETDWWLLLNDEPVGYWPSELFTGKLRDAAEFVQFGEIINLAERHTNTSMGSGYCPEAGHKVAAYQRNLQIVDAQRRLRDAHVRVAKPPASRCYSALIGSSFRDWASHFFYGGRGYSGCELDWARAPSPQPRAESSDD